MLKVKRNDSCPCGSGRNYKACCQPRDEARERVRAVVGDDVLEAAEALAQSAIAAQDVWEADVASLPVPPGEKEGTPALLLITTAGLIVHGEMIPTPPATAEDRATAIALGMTAAGQPPGELHVRDAELAGILAPRLRARNVEVRASDLADMDAVLRAVTGGVLESSSIAAMLTTPDTWRETGASREALAALHQAAAEFYRLAPWTRPELQYPLLLEFPGGAPWGGSVMGEGGMSYGLALHSDPGDLTAMLLTGPGLESLPDMNGYTLTVDFDERGALTRPMQREIVAAGWPVAGPRAYVRLFGLNLPEGRVTAEHVRQATTALEAVIAAARGKDPEAETGVRISPFPLPGEWADDDEDSDDPLDWFIISEEAAPICPEGPNADPEAAIAAWDDHERIQADEEARLARFLAWLPTARWTGRMRGTGRTTWRGWPCPPVP